MIKYIRKDPPNMKKSWLNSLRSIELPAPSLIAIVSLYFLVFLNFSFWRYIGTHADFSNVIGVLFALSIPLVLFTVLYLLVALLFLPYIGKPLFIVLLIISAATNYFMYQFGVFIDADMIRNTFETNPGEIKDLITFRSVLWLTLLGILPAFCLSRIKITYSSFRKEIWGRAKPLLILLACVLVLLPFLYKEYASFVRNNRQMRRLLNPTNYVWATFRYFQEEHENKRPFIKLDENAALVPYADKKKTIFIMVIGETARAMNFSLNGYTQGTNPQLKKQDIVNFKHVQAVGTSTAFSVPAIFSFLSRKNFNPHDAKYSENMLDLLQQTGYEILWKENDNGCKGVCKRVPYEETDAKNEQFCDGRYCHDEILLEGLEEFVANTKGDAFIVLHTIGSHGPTYYRRYPPAFKQFTPTCDTAEIQTCTQEQIINTYDNTILYTDYFISAVIDILKKFPAYQTGLLYVSDHGESLGENGIYLHSLPYLIAPKEQTSVPMIVWMNDTMKKSAHIDYACLKEKAATDKFSHDHLSHSLLALMQVDSKWYDKKLDLFDACRMAPLPRKSKDDK